MKGICNHFSWNFLNGGQIFRDEAERRELTLSEFGDLCANDFSVDKSLDDILKENMLKNDGPEVIESRLSGWWAYKLNLDCVRLWVDVSEKVRAERVVEREGISSKRHYLKMQNEVKKTRLDILKCMGYLLQIANPIPM